MDELDSMSTVEFGLDLEERSAIKIPDKDPDGLTFRQLLEYLEQRVAPWRSDRPGERACRRMSVGPILRGS